MSDRQDFVDLSHALLSHSCAAVSLIFSPYLSCPYIPVEEWKRTSDFVTSPRNATCDTPTTALSTVSLSSHCFVHTRWRIDTLGAPSFPILRTCGYLWLTFVIGRKILAAPPHQFSPFDMAFPSPTTFELAQFCIIRVVPFESSTHG
jgi:hypothetical protein